MHTLAVHAPPSVPGYELIMWLGALNGAFFIFAFGAIVGSFLNVVVYRLPAGIGLVNPPSACPHCGTRLTWRENFPILGWLWLRGRCRFCRSPISVQYPLIELLVAVLFALTFVLWFMDPHIPGLDPGYWRPVWASDRFAVVWPTVLVIQALLACLVAITLIDARTFTIPLAIPWLAAGLALVVHPLHAVWIQYGTRTGHLSWNAQGWTMATVDGPALGAALGSAAGLILANVLLRLGVLKHSFADYEQWEREHPEPPSPHAGATGSAEGAEHASALSGAALKTILLRTFFFTGPGVALMAVGFSVGLSMDKPLPGMGIGMLVGLLIGTFLRRLVKDPADGVSADPIWVQYPFARREMLRELLFLAPAVLLGWLGWWLVGAGPLAGALDNPPLWLRALGGSIAGLLVGGGLVWGIRILGTLSLGREAMGLGDVHLMAAVGAVLGWMDPTAAFFIAPFLGLGWTILTMVLGRWFKLHGTALPYGPHLAAATVIVIFLKPLLHDGLNWLMGRGVVWP